MLALLHDYGNNLARYREWQEYFRKNQPPALIVWGSNDQIFPPEIARLMADFLDTKVPRR